MRGFWLEALADNHRMTPMESIRHYVFAYSS